MTKEEALLKLEGKGIDISDGDMVSVLSRFLSFVMASVIDMIYREGMEINDRTMPDSWFKSEREN